MSALHRGDDAMDDGDADHLVLAQLVKGRCRAGSRAADITAASSESESAIIAAVPLLEPARPVRQPARGRLPAPEAVLPGLRLSAPDWCHLRCVPNMARRRLKKDEEKLAKTK